MNHEKVHERLHDYVDGALGAAEKEQIAQHLRECESCRNETRHIQSLVAAMHALTPSIEPPEDLWPAIDSRIDGKSSVRRLDWSARYRLAAAALFLIVASSTVTWWLTRRDGVSTAETAHLAEAHFMRTELEYVRAIAALQGELRATADGLSPELKAVVDENLRVIDEAIREMRAALAANPENVEIVEILSGVYRAKLDVLQRATRMSFES